MQAVTAETGGFPTCRFNSASGRLEHASSFMLFAAYRDALLLRYCTAAGGHETFIFSPSPYLMPLGFGNSY